MRGSDDPRIRIGEQNRRAIGGQDAEHDPGTVRDHCIDVRTRIVRKWRDDCDGIGRVDLMHSDQSPPRCGSLDGDCSILMDCFTIIVAPEPDVEPGADTLGDAAFAAEETVWQAIEQPRPCDFDVHRTSASFARQISSSSA